MGKYSSYKYLKLLDKDPPLRINVQRRTGKQPWRLKKVFIVLLIVTFLTYFISMFAGQTYWLDGLAKSLGYESVFHYAVIIDAGSSGSRVLAYKFRVPYTVYGPANLGLEEEYFEQSKPGLSSYADDPEKGADTIVQLIKNAEFLTPPEKRKDTPLIVRATAGLRLLPEDKAQKLIDSVKVAISKLGYKVDPEGGVEIMKGSDEGIFIWYTVNLLHNLMNSKTMAALDLGGGSTQITYSLENNNLDEYPAQDRHVVQAGNNITLYTHSYLNLGLLAARFGIFKMEAETLPTNNFVSACVDPIIKNEPWVYANNKYFISGANRTTSKRAASYARCKSAVKTYVLATMDWQPVRRPPAGVAAMSFFYDVAADAGIIDVAKGGEVTIAVYRDAAIIACSASNVEQPWACIDLTFVVALLKDGYKIRDNESIKLFKKIDGHEVSWALGLAYTSVMNRIRSNAS